MGGVIANYKVQTTVYKIVGLENKIKRILRLTTFVREESIGSLILCTNYKLQNAIHEIVKLEDKVYRTLVLITSK